jgi:hypothetical protein
LGKRKPVRHLKKAGILSIILHQHIEIHRLQRYSTEKQCARMIA